MDEEDIFIDDEEFSGLSDFDDSEDSEASSSTSGTSEDDFLSKPEYKTMAYYIRGMSKYSEETKLILSLIRDQRILFENRIFDFKMSKNFLGKLTNIFKAYGIQFVRCPDRKFKRKERVTFLKKIKNLDNCLREIRQLEDDYGRELWIIQFVSLHNLLVNLEPKLSDSLLRSFILDIYMKCESELDKRNWYMISKHISAIQFSMVTVVRLARRHPDEMRPQDAKWMKDWNHIRHNCEPSLFYLTSLFLASVQRHLQLGESADITLGLIDETVECFQRTSETRANLWSNPGCFFVLNGIIFKTCHRFYDKVLQIMDIPLLQIEQDWQRAFFIYKTICEYELFCLNRDTLHARSLLSAIEGHFESLKYKQQLLLLVPVMIELCYYLEEGEILFDLLETLLNQCPYLFTHVSQILIANGGTNAPLSLFEVIVADNSEKLAALDVTPALLKTYSNEPGKYGPVDEIVKINLQTAFATLDYGRNRDNEDAWKTLHENLRRVENESGVISQFWDSRKSWWPHFHGFDKEELGNVCPDIKKECFEFLNEI